MNVNILQLFPKELNSFGDQGNIEVLKKRLEWRDYKVKIWQYEPGSNLPRQIDLIIGGGDQFSNLKEIEKEFRKISRQLKTLIENDTPMLATSATFWMLGKYIQEEDDSKIDGLDILKIATITGNEAICGNIILDSPEFGEVVGYENHKKQVILGEQIQSLGIARKGQGNNMTDKDEGCRYRNLIGTNLSGPILAKNPRITDFLIQKSLAQRSCKVPLTTLNDRLENRAHKASANRPR